MNEGKFYCPRCNLNMYEQFNSFIGWQSNGNKYILFRGDKLWGYYFGLIGYTDESKDCWEKYEGGTPEEWSKKYPEWKCFRCGYSSKTFEDFIKHWKSLVV